MDGPLPDRGEQGLQWAISTWLFALAVAFFFS